MSSMKRTLSVLLAVVMVFSTMAAAFTVVSSATVVPRYETPNPEVEEFKVPKYLFVHGTNEYIRGTTVEGGDTIRLVASGISDVTLQCENEPAVSFSKTGEVVGQSVTWTVGDGGSITGQNDYVKWHVRYKVNNKYYDTYAWSAVKIVYHDPGFATRFWYDAGFWEAHETKNYHVEWATPVYGNYYGATNFNVYVTRDPGKGERHEASGVLASALFEEGESDTHTMGATAIGNYYVDKNAYTDLSQTTLRIGGTVAQWADYDDTHIHQYRGVSLQSAKIGSTDVTGYSVSSNNVDMEQETNDASRYTVVAETVSGPVSTITAGSTLKLGFKTHWKGNLDALYSHSNDSYGLYELSIIVYDKSALKTALTEFTSANYQESQYYASAPSGYGSNSNFRSWSQYQTALQNAWVIYGKEDVSKAQIDAAVTALNACKPTYSNGTWTSGMMMTPANYDAIDLLIDNLPKRFKENTYNDDGSYGLYYKYSLANPVNIALNDIAADRPLRSSYQDVVDLMKTNLVSAINNLGTGTGSYKTVNIEYATSETGVQNMPATTTTPLFTSVAKPENPTKQYYRFDGWYYDAALTQAVSWPIAITPTGEHFSANVQLKQDNIGTAMTLYAKFTMTGTTLSFATNGGSVIDTVIGNSGDPYAGPSQTPTKYGHTFGGWYMDEELTVPVDWTTFKFGDTDTVYAKWDRATFTVTFNANGGIFPTTGVVTSRTSGLYGNAIVRPETPVRSGYGFVCWCSDAAAQNPVNLDTFTIPGQNTTLYAKWSNTMRNLTFVYGNGTAPLTNSYEIGTTINQPVNPYRSGYDFIGWFFDETYQNAVSFPYEITENKTIYAGWRGWPFNITFNPGAGSMASDFNANDYKQIPCGTTITPPTAPTREGYVFTGWLYNNEPYELTTMPAYDLFLEAGWDVEPPTAHFRLRTDKAGTVEQGDIINATVSLRTNYITGTTAFIVYYDRRFLAPAMNDAPYTNQVGTSAACSKTPGTAYFTVVQNPGVTNVTDTGSALTTVGRVNISDKNGIQNYYPADWLDVTMSGGKATYSLKTEYQYYDYVYFNVGESTDGTHAEPVEEQDIASFQFIVLDTASTASGAYAQLLMPEGYFKVTGSGKEKICCAREDTIQYMTGADTTYYEGTVYDLINNDIRFTVTPMRTSTVSFDSKGGSAIPNKTDKVGRTVQLSIPEKANHEFLGWATTENGTDYVNANAYVMPENDITLYAQWKGNATTYYVYHYLRNVDDSSWMEPIPEEKTGDIGSTVAAVPLEYEGFYVNNSDSNIVPATGILILKLYYFRMDVQITLNASSGTFTNGSQTYVINGKYGQTIRNDAGDPVRTGYAFQGWLYGGQPYEMTTFPAVSAMELVADWEAEEYTLTFILDGRVYGTITQPYNTPVTAPSVTAGENQVFSGWRDGTGQPFSYTRMPAGDETFTGTLAMNGYTITLVIDGKQYGQPILFNKGAVITRDMVNYVPPTGYSFDGWHTTRSMTSSKYSFPLTLNEDKTFYGFTAQRTYTITTMVYLSYELGGDDAFENWGEISGLYGDSIVNDFAAIEEQFEYQDGCAFNGWYLDEDLTIPYTKPSTMPAEDLVIYGELYQIVGTVIFNTNGATSGSVEPMSAPIGETITLPGGTGLTYKYYKFMGWGATPDATTAITSVNIEQEGETTVYAIWARNYANLSFQLNGGTGTTPASMRGEVGETLTLPAGEDLIRDGFLFDGWSTDRNATSGVKTLKIVSTTDVILYAAWRPLRVSLVARAGSSTVIDDEHGYIYGVGMGMRESDLLDTYLDVDGDGTIRLEYAGYLGTGAKVKLYNNFTGNVDAEYTLIIFGDLNGDSIVDTEDIKLLRGHSTGAAEFAADSPEFFAADLNLDGDATMDDGQIMKGVYTGALEMDQATRKIL